MYGDLYIRTQYDGHDYRSIFAIYHYDNDGNEEELDDLTNMCMDISTCADQGTDTWTWLKDKVAERLNSAGITYNELMYDEDEGDI